MSRVSGGARRTAARCTAGRLAHGVTWNDGSADEEGGEFLASAGPVRSTVDFGPALVVRLDGEFDIATVPELRVALAIALNELTSTVLLLDLRRVTFADASFVGVLEEATDALRRSGGELHVVNAPCPVARVLRLCDIPHQASPQAPCRDGS